MDLPTSQLTDSPTTPAPTACVVDRDPATSGCTITNVDYPGGICPANGLGMLHCVAHADAKLATIDVEMLSVSLANVMEA